MQSSHPETVVPSISLMTRPAGTNLQVTLLVVEDEAMVRRVVCEILRHAGYRVLKARNAAEACAIVDREQRTVHLLITDVVLPGKNGRELAEVLTESCPGMSTIFMSG